MRGSSDRTELLESVAVYDGLPISSGGAHGLGRISARDAFRSWTHFLETCTRPSGIECWFAFPRTPELAVDADVRRVVAQQFAEQRGRYEVPSDQLDDALSVFESLEPLPSNRWGMGPVWLWFSAEFQVRSPTSTELWPGQDPARYGEFRTPSGLLLGSSSTRLILHAKRSMGLVLSLPRASDADLAAALPWLQRALPMRLSAKHWTRWTLTEDGQSYRAKKIAPILSS